MLIRNGKLFLEDRFSYQDLRIRGDRIAEILPLQSKPEEGEEVLNAFGAYVIPGMIDLQVHGAAGRDFSDANDEAQRDIARFLLRHGVTGYLAACDSFPEEILLEACSAAADRVGVVDKGAVLYGINLMGPFISPERRGFQEACWLRNPDIGLLRRLQEQSGGAIRIVNLSPELPGARDFIREAKDLCAVSLTRSGVDFDEARMCYSLGARNVSDIFQEMPPFTAEEPGLLGAAMDICRYATLQMDGHMPHPASVRMAYLLFTAKRLCLTANTSAYCGLRDDTYLIEGHQVTVRGGHAVFEDGREAGSCRTLDEIVRMVARLGGLPLANAFRSVTETPARALGIYDEVGSITPGKRADLTILHLHRLTVQHVFLAGEKQF